MNPTRRLVWLGLFLASLACQNSETKARQGAPTAVPSATDVAPAPANPEPQRPAPADIVLDPLLKDLKCDKRSKGETCRVLNEFAEGSRWIAQTPSGEGRWIGNAYVREKGVEKKELIILWAKQVPTSQVGPGDLPIRVGTGTLSDELIEHGFKMVTALSHSDPPSKRNQARQAVETFVPTVQRGAVNTAGASVRLISEDTVYLRQSGRKVLILMPSQSQSASPGDGRYAEVWRATW